MFNQIQFKESQRKNNKYNKCSFSAKTNLRTQQTHPNKNTPRVEMVGYISCIQTT